MSLRVGWNFGSTAEDEYQDVPMQDPPCWTATSTVLKAGRGLSSWLFSNLSPPSSPLDPSSFCEDPFSPRQTPNPGCSPQRTVFRTPYPSPTPSFIDKLPQELLEEIFREYLHGPTATSPSPNNALTGSFHRIVTAIGTKTTPFTPAHVCSKWRNTVMSNPSLWSRVCAFQPEPQDIPLFEVWLSRTASSLLDLTIVEKGKGGSESIDTTTYRVLLISMAQAHRWRTVTLQLGPDMEPPLATNPHLVSLPSLHAFHLNFFNWTVEGCQWVSQLLSTSAALRHRAWGNLSQTKPFIPGIPWGMLQSIQLGQANLPDLLPVLSSAISLESLAINYLSVNCDEPVPPMHQTTPHIQLHHLSSLSLTHYDYISPLFDLLVVPSLSTLTLRAGVGSGVGPEVGWASLASLVRRSSCHILSFNWTHGASTETMLLEHLTRSSTSILPELSHLRVESPVSKQTVAALTGKAEGTDSIFPHLRALELTDCTVDQRDVYAMLSSRPQLRQANIKIRNFQTGDLACVVVDDVKY